MRSLSRIQCFTVGCTNEASVTINGDHVCTQCARADLPADMHKFLNLESHEQSLEDILVWPCGTWCYREELNQMSHLSDDYQVLWFDTDAYISFLQVNELI